MGEKKPVSAFSFRRVWALTGGLAGIATIMALALTLASTLQQFAATKAAATAEAQVVGIMDRQLDVQEAMATALAGGLASGPTATAVAQSIAGLVSTRAALEVDRTQAEATLTVLARPRAAPGAPATATPSPESVPPTPAAARTAVSTVPGLTAELRGVEYFQNTLTVHLTYAFAGPGELEPVHVWPGVTTLLDEATHKRYLRIDSGPLPLARIPAGATYDTWAKYDLPRDDGVAFVSIVLADGILFDRVPVPQ
jgi:hypothetical protein